MDVDDLRLVVSVVEGGSLTAAASRMGVSLNAVSRRLGRLEASLGVTLIQRSTRSCEPTDPGMTVYRRALTVLEQLDELHGAMERYRGAPSGVVRARMPASAVTTELLVRLKALLDQHEGLQVHLTVHRRDAPLGQDVDVALFVGSLPDRVGIVARRVRTFRWVACAAPSYIDVRGRPADVAGLSSHDCLRYRADDPEEHWVLEHLDGRRATVPVGGVFESDDGRVLADAVYAGFGVGILPEGEVAAGVERGVLVEVLPGWSFSPPPVYLAGPAGRMRMPAVRTVADAMATVLAEVSDPSRQGARRGP